MLYIFLKIILCSSLLITVYHLLLEKEKMHQFNRFFLLFSIVFSYTIPFISIPTESPISTTNSQLVFEETTQQILSIPIKQESFDWTNAIWIGYGIITFVLLIKAFASILKIRTIKGKRSNYLNYRIVITENNFPPFTFWKTIYLGESYLINGKIDPRIFLHERSHLDQKHSWDLILIEIIKVFTWFNPAIYFYEKAIVTNHEFLADETVLENNFDSRDYQNLILNEIIDHQKLDLTHSFNFNNTKKRFIMMNTKKSKFSWLKKAISIPILITAFVLFVQKTYANNYATNMDAAAKTVKEAPFTKTLQKMISKKENSIHQKTISDTIRPTKKTTAKKVKTNKNTTFPPPPPPTIEKQKKVNNNENSEVPPPPPPTTAFSPAKFPSGINELRNKFAKTFDGSVISGNERHIKSEISISIKEDGTVDKIKTNGNNKAFNDEVYRTVKAATENVKWEPATENGKPVASIYRLPITMAFENTKK